MRQRTIVQSIVGPHSDFSTTVKLEPSGYGGMPELHVELSGVDIAFSLIVPSPASELDSVEAGPQRAALATLTSPVHATRAAAHAGGSRLSPVRSIADTQRPARAPGIASRQVSNRPIERQAARTSPAVVPIFITFMAIVVAIAWALLRPQVSRLGVPAQARAASRITVAYRAIGLGSVTYAVIDPNADTIARGPLANGAHAFAIALPSDPTNRAYLVRVVMTGVLGSALAQEYVRVPAIAATVAAAPVAATPVAARAIAPPQIRSLALDRAALAAGDTLTVYYDVAATGGSVELLDGASQIVYGKSELSAAGHSAFVIPAFATERFLNIVVTARRGTASMQSRVGVTVSAPSSPVPQRAPDGGAPLSRDTAASVVPLIATPRTVRSAQPIHVDVRDAVAGLVLVLSDGAGNELARREFTTASDATSATFLAPRVTTLTRFRLQATYPQGAGSETVVKTIDVRPR